MYLNNMALSAYGTELPFRQSVAKIPSERTAQVSPFVMYILSFITHDLDKLFFLLFYNDN